jgi:hypothetical protein
MLALIRRHLARSLATHEALIVNFPLILEHVKGQLPVFFFLFLLGPQLGKIGILPAPKMMVSPIHSRDRQLSWRYQDDGIGYFTQQP